jgi:hypothetical protein
VNASKRLWHYCATCTTVIKASVETESKLSVHPLWNGVVEIDTEIITLLEELAPRNISTVPQVIKLEISFIFPVSYSSNMYGNRLALAPRYSYLLSA